jgi:hypothetical protein
MQWFREACISFAEKTEVDWIAVSRLKHAFQMPRPGRAGGRERPVSRSSSAADQGGNAGSQGIIDLLRTNKMDVRIDSASSNDFAFSGDYFRPGSNDDGHSRLDIGVTGFANAGYPALLYPDIGLYYSAMIYNHGVRYYRINALFAGALGLSHPVSNHLSATELDLFSVDREVSFDLYEKLGIGQPDEVAGGWTKHLRVGLSANFHTGIKFEAPALSLILSESTHDFCVETEDRFVACQFDELDGPCLSRFESHRRAGDDIQTKTAGLLAIELKSFIDFVKMVVGSDLDGSITGI